VAGTTFRDRERLVLLSGAAAAAFFALVLLARIVGMPFGSFGGKVAVSLILVYLCARCWGHAKTLEERGTHDTLSLIGRAGAPVILFVLLAQTWVTSSIPVSASLADPLPHLTIGLWTRVEWSADVMVIGLFLATATAVWIEDSTGLSAQLSRVCQVCIAVLTLDLLACVWGMVSILPQWKLVAALMVLSLAGTVLVATFRRLERLDEARDESAAQL